MKKVTMLMLVICAMSVTACQTETAEEKQNKLKKDVEFVDNDLTKYMHYVQDPRTGMCFARSQMNGGWYVYTPIDCTSRVKELLLNKLQ